MHFVTFQVIDWVDVFTRQIYRDEIIDNFQFYRKQQGLQVHAYVIMSNHIHAILSATQGKIDLSTLINRFKSYTSRSIEKLLQEEPESRREWMIERFQLAASQHQRNAKFQFWTHDNHPIELDTIEKLRQRMDYVHDNPVKAGIVEKPKDYLYSSARNYHGLWSVMPIDPIDEVLPGQLLE
jgi:REP element-mobilizing transposase RayT